MDGKGPRPIRTFGRIGGRGLSARQQGLLANTLPGFSIDVPTEGLIDPRDLFAEASAVWLEIGFGGGEHLLAQAERHPDIGFIGCEPFIDGMVKVLTGIEESEIKNIRLLMDDARPLVKALQLASIARAFILFPDPWPKMRQQKRRLIQTDFLDDLARVLSPGASVRFATDVKSYADEALHRFLSHGAFTWTASQADDWRKPPADHIRTRYEAKQLGDCAPVWFDFSYQP